VRFTQHEFAEIAGADAPQGFAIQLVGPRLKIDEENQLVLGGPLPGFRDRQATGHIHGDRLGQKHMLAGGHRGGGVLRMEIGWRFDDHGVELAIEQFLVASQAAETTRRFDPELLARGIHAVLIVIRAGHPLVLSRIQEQLGEPVPSTSAANQADCQLLIRLIGLRQRGSRDDKARRAETGHECSAIHARVSIVLVACHDFTSGDRKTYETHRSRYPLRPHVAIMGVRPVGTNIPVLLRFSFELEIVHVINRVGVRVADESDPCQPLKIGTAERQVLETPRRLAGDGYGQSPRA
jgi:hypothetical protein